MTSTPIRQVRRSKFISPSPSSSYKSPLLNTTARKVDLEYENISIEKLKESTLELWQKCENNKQEIMKLENEGYKEEQLKWYIDKLHEYNEIKDVAQMVMGRIAILEETTVKEIHEQFGMKQED